MQVAESFASLSNARRSKVGAVIVTENGVILGGVNGMAPNTENTLEKVEYKYEDYTDREVFESIEGYKYVLVTKPNVIHAEINAVLKAAKEGVSIVNSTLYVTLTPCEHCAEMILAAGIKRVVYKEEYRSRLGLIRLAKNGVLVEKFGESLC